MRSRQTDWREPKTWPLWIWGTAAVVGGISLFCVVPIGWNIYSEMDALEAADNEDLEAAATAFGRRGTTFDCEAEALNRLDRCTQQSKQRRLTDEKREHQKACLMEGLHWHRHCLNAATPHDEFCARAPGTDAMAGARLQARVCSSRYPSFEAPGCRQIVQQSWLHCAVEQD